MEQTTNNASLIVHGGRYFMYVGPLDTFFKYVPDLLYPSTLVLEKYATGNSTV